MNRKLLALIAAAAFAGSMGVAQADETKTPEALGSVDVAAYQPLSNDEMAQTVGTYAFADAYGNASAYGPNFAGTSTSTYVNASSYYYNNYSSSSSHSSAAGY